MDREKLDSSKAVGTLLEMVERAHRNPGDQLCCVHCQTAVTTANQKTSINQSHNFHFANPEGNQFDLACFSEAWGCGMFGPLQQDDSWFSGYRWQFARCLSCDAHLGWYYEEGNIDDTGEHFFGLLIDKLVPAEPPVT